MNSEPIATRATNAETMKLLGGALCLDFVNTVDWRLSPQPTEWLTDYGVLVRWAVHAGGLDLETGDRLITGAERDPKAASRVLGRAIAIRETLHRLFLGDTIDPQDLNRFNAAFVEAPSRIGLAHDGDELAWAIEGGEERLDAVLAPVLWSAAELLASPERLRVRRCADHACGWIFLDASRSARRQWCAMEDCGNRNKARRHYSRSKREKASQSAQ